MESLSRCPSCQIPYQPGEKFCASCGVALQPGAAPPAPDPRIEESRLAEEKEKKEHLKKIKTGRGWILAVSILTMIGGIALHFIQKGQVEKDIQQVEAEMRTYSPDEMALFHQNFEAETGMTWQEAKDAADGEVVMILVIMVALSLVFFGLWWWAKTNPFPAALTALIIYVTLLAADFIADPASLAKGIIIKVLLIAGLIGAVSSSYKYRRMQALSGQ